VTFGAIIAVIRDVVIVAAIGIVIYLLIHYGEDVVKVTDMAAVQRQITANIQTEAQWRQEQTDADSKRDTEIQQISAAIGAQRAPVYTVQPSAAKARSCAVSSNPITAGGQPAVGGSADSGRGEDLRPAINAFELKYETALADCRSVLSQWPKGK
jgi:hypothetical protein